MINRFGGLVKYFIALRRDGVLFNLFDADRLKGRIADMMSDLDDLHSVSAQFVEGLRCEMQSGGRRRNRPTLACEDGLIARLVQSPFFGALAFNVWRQRRIADLVNDPVEIAGALKTDALAAFLHNCCDDATQSPVAELKLRADLQ